MANYATLDDAAGDPALTIDEIILSRADVAVDADLRERGINPSDVTLPQALLTQLAVNHARRIAAVEGSLGDNSPLIPKAREYEKSARQLAASISREALGLTVATGAGFGNVVIGRG
jgi:hypothetical protein